MFTGARTDLKAAGHPAPLPQSEQSGFPLFRLTPDVTTSIQLQTHTADFQISSADVGAISVAYEGLYRFKNEGEDPVLLPLVFLHDGLEGRMPLITLTADGLPVTAQQIENGYRSEVWIAPDTTLDFRLSYSAPLDASLLAEVRYDVRDLVAWPGSSSLRTTIVMPENIVPESWINIAPDGWNYATTADARTVGVRWLFDGAFPQSEFLMRFVTPETWQRIGALSAASPADAVATIELGRLYQQIYLALHNNSVPETHERFYAQALATYISGIETAEANGQPPPLVAEMRAGLASLYRDRILQVGGDPDSGYLSLMVQTTTDALAGLPDGDARRSELQQWQADGLRQLLVEAQQKGNWPVVVALLDQMEQLPQPPLSPDALREARRAAIVLQALELLESGQRDAAIDLAGDQITDEALQPGPEMQSLFSGWQVTTTITTAGVELDFTVFPAAGQLEAARTALQEQLSRWKSLPVRSTASVQLSEIAPAPDDIALRLEISLADRDAALSLAQGMFPGPDWALLHTLLEQIAPLIQTNDRWLRRQLTMEQTLDLRGAGTEWLSMAQNLDAKAQSVDATGRGVNPSDPAAVEAALRARVQASNYRTASQEWRNLASNSWVTTELKASESASLGNVGSASSRSWLATVDMPVQTYSLRAETLNPMRLGFLVVLLLGFLLLFSGLLWRLL